VFLGKYLFKVTSVILETQFKYICNSHSCEVQPEELSACERAFFLGGCDRIEHRQLLSLADIMLPFCFKICIKLKISYC